MTSLVMWSHRFPSARRGTTQPLIMLAALAAIASGFMGAGIQRAAANDVRPLRQQLEAELSTLRKNYNGNISDYRSGAKALKDKYLGLDQGRSDALTRTLDQYKGQIENTGSKPRDVRADIDLKANSGEAADRLKQDWQKTYGADNIVEHPHKIVNKATDTTLWKPCNTPECMKVKVQDPDAWTTEGGLKSTGNSDRFRDPIGQYLDNEKKLVHAREDFGHATADPKAIDQPKVFESVKTASKSLSKASEAAGLKNPNDPFWKAVDGIRTEYMDPYEAGIADPRDPPEKQVKDIEDFLTKADAEMLKAKGTLDARGKITDYVRERAQEEMRRSGAADPLAEAMNREGADAIARERERIAESNKAVEDFNKAQGGVGEQAGTEPPRKDLETIREEARARRERAAGTGPSGQPGGDSTIREPGRGTGPAPGTTAEPVAPPERTTTPGADGPAPTARERARAGAGKVGVGLAQGAAVTFMTCMATSDALGKTMEDCLAEAGLSVFDPTNIGLEAIAALGPLGEVLVGIYGAHHAGRAVGQAIKEGVKLSDAIRTQNEAVNILTTQLVDAQRTISSAMANCQYEQARGIAQGLRERFSGLGLRPDGSVVRAAAGTSNVNSFAPWLPSIMPDIENKALAQRGVDTLLAKARATSDPKLKSEFLNAAEKFAAGTPCLTERVRAAQSQQPGGNKEQTCIYIIDASGGSVWLGTEEQQKRTSAASIKGAGIGKAPPRVIRLVSCHPTRQAATDAWCAELRGKKTENWVLAHNSKADVYGGKYWIGSAPSCPAKVVRSLIQQAPPIVAAGDKAKDAVASCDVGRITGVRNEFAARGATYKLLVVEPAQEAIDRISRVRDPLAEARTLFNGGKLAEARASVGRARTSLRDWPGHCPSPATEIDRVSDEIARTDDAIKGAETAVSACSKSKLDASKSALSRSPNPAAKAMLTVLTKGAEECAERERVKKAADKAKDVVAACDIGKIKSFRDTFAKSSEAYRLTVVEPLQAAHDRIERVRDPLNEARTLLNAGRLDDARSGVGRARIALGSLPNRCPPLGPDIDRIAEEISRIQDAIRIAGAAVSRCDKAKLNESKSALARLSNPAARAMLVTLNSEAVECERKAVTAANDFCRGKYGSFSLSVGHTDTQVSCNCHKGYRWTSDRSSCERIPSPQEIAQDNLARCHRDFGGHSYAGSAAKDGSVQCYCNRGYTWGADKRCISEREAADEKHASCRSSFGPYAVSVGANRDGTSQCNCPSGYNWDADKKCAPISQITSAATAHCQSDFGPYATVANLVDGKNYKCNCQPGYHWGNEGGKQICVRAPSKAEVMAEGNGLCQNKYGRGSYAVRQNRDGTFTCWIPGRAAAPQPTYRPRGRSAEEIAAATAVIGGIIAATRRPRGPSAPPAARCHRGRDGRVHCGGG